MPEEGLRAHLVEDRARVHARGHLEGDAAGNVRLDEAGDDVDRRALRGKNQMQARSARLLRQTRDELLDLLADDHHQIGELIDHHDHVGQRGEILDLALIDARIVRCAQHHHRILDRFAGLQRILHAPVEAADIAHPERGHQLIAPLHLRDAPAQRVGRLFHVGHDRREQVRDALVNGQLQHLRIDHDEAHVLGGGLIKERQHHRVDAD